MYVQANIFIEVFGTHSWQPYKLESTSASISTNQTKYINELIYKFSKFLIENRVGFTLKLPNNIKIEQNGKTNFQYFQYGYIICVYFHWTFRFIFGSFSSFVVGFTQKNTPGIYFGHWNWKHHVRISMKWNQERIRNQKKKKTEREWKKKQRRKAFQFSRPVVSSRWLCYVRLFVQYNALHLNIESIQFCSTATSFSMLWHALIYP